MNEEEFGKLANEILERAAKNLVTKASRDYAVPEDKLYNFHSAAPILGSAEKACLAYATKHYLSITKFVQDGQPVDKDLALEKIGDLISYMVILYALMAETRDSKH